MTETSSITLSEGLSSFGESVTLTLSSYINYEEEARRLVKGIIDQSLKVYQAELEATMEWPTGGTFTIDKGTAAIDKLVQVNGAWNVFRSSGSVLGSSDRLVELALVYRDLFSIEGVQILPL